MVERDEGTDGKTEGTGGGGEGAGEGRAQEDIVIKHAGEPKRLRRTKTWNTDHKNH